MPAAPEPTAVLSDAEQHAATFFGGSIDEDGTETVVEARSIPDPVPVVTTPATAPTAEPVAEAIIPDDAADSDETPPEKPRSAQERINQAVGKQRAAERLTAAEKTRADAFEARIAALEGGLTQKPTAATVDTNAPDPAKYTYAELDSKYIADLARYEVRKEIAADRAQASADQETKTRQAQASAFEKTVTDFTTTGAKKYPDFADTVIASATAGDWPLSPTLGQLLIESEHGADIAYTLATDHAEAKRIHSLPPEKQAVWFGRQEGKYASASPDDERKPAPKVTQAPTPLASRVRPGGSPNPVTADTSDFAAFEAMARQNRKQ